MRLSDHEFNRLSVLKNLRAAEPISRTELARLSRLTGGTITSIVANLVQRGLVVEERMPVQSAGRPRINLHINRNGAFAAAAHWSEDSHIVVQVVDLKGEQVHVGRTAFTRTDSLVDLAHQFANAIGQTIASSPIAADQIAQTGIGLPAIVNTGTGVVEALETFSDAPCDFAAIVTERLGVPTRIDNDNNLIARAEHWFGEGAGVDDFTVVQLDLGLGAARYQRGELLLGSRSIEAELGHTKIIPENGRPCHCGARGCLQSYSSISGIVGMHADLTGDESPPFYKLRKRFADLVRMAKSGDEATLDLFTRAGAYLGTGIANHINMQDPERIVILSREPDLNELIRPAFFEALHRDTLPVLRDPSKVTFKQLSDQSYSQGAAAMVLEQLYKSR